MDKIEELLPGLEEFFTKTLDGESLSSFAEERRQFFIERIDILKLPPSVPPREGRVLPPELLDDTEPSIRTPACHGDPDFAATQRHISRSFIDHSTSKSDVPLRVRSFSERIGHENVKVYDDIDLCQSGIDQDSIRHRSISESTSVRTADEDNNDDGDENGLYEIPVARQRTSLEDTSLSYGTDGSSLVTTGSTEDLPDDVLECAQVQPPSINPPVPPRRDIKFSDSGSLDSLPDGGRPPELPFRPPLPKRSQIYTLADKPDKTEKPVISDLELSGDGDSTSYESFEEDYEHQNTEMASKEDIKLPKKAKKKTKLRRSKKLDKYSPNVQSEINVPFKKLDNVDISGELFLKGKLKWNRKIVAISSGYMVVYKLEKDSRPCMVIPLRGYEATVLERDGKRGFEVKMEHPEEDCHTFAVECKEWAMHWIEHINCSSKGQSPPRYHTHLASTYYDGVDYGLNAGTYGSKLKVIDSARTKTRPGNTEINLDLDDRFITEEDGSKSFKQSAGKLLPDTKIKTLAPRSKQADKKRRHVGRNQYSFPKKNPFRSSQRDRGMREAMKGILRRRQKGLYTIRKPAPSGQLERYSLKDDLTNDLEKTPLRRGSVLQSLARPLSIACWNWKNFLYNLSLRRFLIAIRGTDIAEPNHACSSHKEGHEEVSRTKLRGTALTRVGSLAYRATQFFENISKKTTPRKKTRHVSTPGLSLSGGDLSEIPLTLAESSISSSNSIGNLPKEFTSPTSDSSQLSVFGDSVSGSSLPPTPDYLEAPIVRPWDLEGGDEHPGVTCRGYLSVFSSFNRRCWGRRWCVVRDNRFLCYKNGNSQECELQFLLRPCVFRRAMAETNSENGLMIQEAGKEKITVKPLSKEDMGQWVRVLLAETSTEQVPEGLEEFLKQPEANEGKPSDLESCPVTDKLNAGGPDMTRRTSCHDYEDLEEALAAAAKLKDTMTTFPSLPVHEEISDTAVPSKDASLEIAGDSITDSSSSIYKQISDSGFYSARGTRCGSDSSCENISREVGGMDCGRAAVDVQSSHNSQSSLASGQSNLEFSTGNADEGFPQKSSVPRVSSDQHVSSSHSSYASSETRKSLPPLELYSSVTTGQDIHNSSGQRNVVTSKNHFPSVSTVSQPGTSTSPNKILSPTGEEYSVVLKQSQRSPKTIKSSSGCAPSLESRNFEEINESVSNESNGNSTMESSTNIHPADAVTDSGKESSYYEPIEPPDSVVRPVDDKVDSSSNIPQLFLKGYLGDQPPPIPRSPIPSTSRNPHFAHKRAMLKSSSQEQGPRTRGSLQKDHVPKSLENLVSSKDDRSIGSEISIDRTSDAIRTLVGSPNTNVDQLKKAMENLRRKESEIKRKRMAVHDKRQRALTDEERLACEKEFAALEKAVEGIDQNIRVVQKSLDIIQGQTLEAMRAAHGKHMTGSKKQKIKRKI